MNAARWLCIAFPAVVLFASTCAAAELQHAWEFDTGKHLPLATSKDYIFLTYIKAVVPFQSGWSGIKAVKRR